MATLPPETMRDLLSPYVSPSQLTDPLLEQLSTYLDLLLRWNARINLTAIRRPEEIVQRHFGESLFTATQLAHRLAEEAELLDYGSGAGFPGLPIQILLPRLRVTLAESQARKVAFLRETVRVLALKTEVWPRRVEEMAPSRRFDAVTLRAVDRMTLSLEAATDRVRDGGWLAALVGRDGQIPGAEEFAVPGSMHRRLWIGQNVPRGTFAAKTL
ncbi:MAG TPA: 16S rRNA (guanine(527)-N(7))-methyltransferase RsmG [Candidatus Aquilonibacter sp.]|nr:16S rRNA (guanine(527)-N(7))-methyltransferase RsmG [Candidatus Aquilonibacter sp.]